MEYDAGHERFFALESALDLFSRWIDGVRFWELVRFAVHRELLREATEFG